MAPERGQIEHFPLMKTTYGGGKNKANIIIEYFQPHQHGSRNSSGHCSSNMNMADGRTQMGGTRIRSLLTQNPLRTPRPRIYSTPLKYKIQWGEWVLSGYWPGSQSASQPSIHSFIHIHIHIHLVGVSMVCYFDVAGRPAGQANLRINYVTLCGRSGCNSTAIKIANHR